MQGINIIKATAKGNIPNQQNSINWSNLILGKVALNHTNKKQKKQVFKARIIDCRLKIVSFVKISPALQPPNHNIEDIVENNTIEEYSAKKKNTKGTLECSVKKTATNSDSASCRSKGVLLVSANIEIKYIINIGNNGTINHIDCWISIIVVKLKDPVNKMMINIAELNINS